MQRKFYTTEFPWLPDCRFTLCSVEIAGSFLWLKDKCVALGDVPGTRELWVAKSPLSTRARGPLRIHLHQHTHLRRQRTDLSLGLGPLIPFIFSLTLKAFRGILSQAQWAKEVRCRPCILPALRATGKRETRGAQHNRTASGKGAQTVTFQERPSSEESWGSAAGPSTPAAWLTQHPVLNKPVRFSIVLGTSPGHTFHPHFGPKTQILLFFFN